MNTRVYDHIKGYMEFEFEAAVKQIELVDCYIFSGAMDGTFSVTMDDAEESEWWVFYGSGYRPMNCYSQKRHPSSDEAFSFHLGLMARLKDKPENVEESCYDCCPECFEEITLTE